MRKPKSPLACALLAIGLLHPGCGRSSEIRYVYFPNANTHESYQTVHGVREAHQHATGKGVKVGIIDKYFGVKKHPELYAGGKDFVNDQERFENVEEHGFWMATTLKELAPGVSVHALNGRATDRHTEAEALARAVDWAIENKIDILTYSAEAFPPAERPIVDRAIETAVQHGITTVFIHNDHPLNILPYTFFSAKGENYRREPDIRVFHLDYNLLLLQSYDKYLKADRRPRSGDEMPYLSVSSTAVVVAAGVAMLKELKPGLPPADCKEIILKAAKPYPYSGRQIERVLNYPKAIEMISGNRSASNLHLYE